MNTLSQGQTYPTALRCKSAGWAARLVLLIAACAFCVWVLIDRIAFNQYSIWDDEGNFILTLTQFLKNGGLYVRTYSQYGPFYAFAESSLHRLFQVPIDLDGARILTVTYILVSAGLLSGFVGRLTRKLELALSCFILTVILGAPMLREPGHPHGIIVSAISAALCLSLLVGTRQQTFALLLLGALSAALALTKINVGLFFCFALGLSLAITLVKSRFRSILLGLIVLGSLIITPVLMEAHLRGWAGPFCLYMLMSFGALYFGAFQSGAANELRPVHIVYLILGFVAGLTPVVCAALLTGSTVPSLVSGILTRPLSQPTVFYVEFRIPAGKLLVLVLPTLLLAAIPLARRKFRNLDRWLAAGKVAIALTVGAAFLWDADRVMFDVLPLLPLLLIPSGGDSGWSGSSFSRIFLVSVIDFEMLQAYPVLGTHHIALAPGGAWICLLLSDGLLGLVASYPRASIGWSLGSSPAAVGWLGVVLGLPVLPFYIDSVWAQQGDPILSRRQILEQLVTGRSLPPLNPLLNLPGARLLRVPVAEASVFRRLAGELHTNCDMLFGMPGLGSLNVWSETPPPNGLNRDDWMLGLTSQEQDTIRTVLAHAARPCIVYNPQLTRFWIRRGMRLDMEETPMVDYVLHGTRTVFSAGEYEIRVPYTRRAQWVLLRKSPPEDSASRATNSR